MKYTFTKEEIDSAYIEISDFVERMSIKHNRNITLGYIGNVSANGKNDDRSWRIFIEGFKTPGWCQIGTLENCVIYAPALDLVETKMNRLLNNLELDCKTCDSFGMEMTLPTNCRLCNGFSHHSKA